MNRIAAAPAAFVQPFDVEYMKMINLEPDIGVYI